MILIPPQAATLLAKPFIKYGVPVALLIIAIIAWKIWLSDVKHDAAKEAVATERQEQSAITLNQVEKASNAAEIIRSSPDVRRAECLRRARNPEDC